MWCNQFNFKNNERLRQGARFGGIVMFEKEAAFDKVAKEWVKENMDCCKTDNSVNQSIPYFDEEERCVAKSAFKDGAEFGYNKANEWHEYSERPKEKINALCFDIAQNKLILGFYDLEADEWLKYGGYETIHIDLWKKEELPIK